MRSSATCTPWRRARSAVETTARALRKQANAGADVDALTPFLQPGLLAGTTADHIKAVAIPTYVTTKRIAEATAELEAAAKRPAHAGHWSADGAAGAAAGDAGGDAGGRDPGRRHLPRPPAGRGNMCRFHHG